MHCVLGTSLDNQARIESVQVEATTRIFISQGRVGHQGKRPICKIQEVDPILLFSFSLTFKK